MEHRLQDAGAIILATLLVCRHFHRPDQHRADGLQNRVDPHYTTRARNGQGDNHDREANAGAGAEDWIDLEEALVGPAGLEPATLSLEG